MGPQPICSAQDVSLKARVERVVQDLSADRPVSDADLLQHRLDCTALMEAAAERWQEGRESRETVELWHARAMEAHKRLSPAWKAAREAQIQRAIADDVGFFVTQGDLDRAKQVEAADR